MAKKHGAVVAGHRSGVLQLGCRPAKARRTESVDFSEGCYIQGEMHAHREDAEAGPGRDEGTAEAASGRVS